MQARPPLSLDRIFLVGAIVPAISTWINYKLLGEMPVEPAYVTLEFVVFIVQLGIHGFLVGRLVREPLVRAFMYGWGWLFCDLHVVATIVQTESSPLAKVAWEHSSAVGAAQVGLLVIWAAMGSRPHWSVRWPLAMALSGVSAMLVAGWCRDVFATQTFALLVICGILAWLGSRLFRPSDEILESPILFQMQFGMRHILIAITGVAILLAILKSQNLLSLEAIRRLRRDQWFVAATGGMTSIVLVGSLWAALRFGRAWLRWLLGVFGGMTAGTALGFVHWVTRPPFRRIPAGIYPKSAWDQFWNLEWDRIAWLSLAGALVFAGLLHFRSRGVRLGRIVRSRSEGTRPQT